MNGDNNHVLVVDDDELARLEIARSVEQAGYTVSQAESGARALDMLRKVSFDLVLLDLLMPGMDGFEVLEHIKADTALSEVPVIVITAVDDRDTTYRSIDLGAVDNFSKPVNHHLLIHRIRKVLS